MASQQFQYTKVSQLSDVSTPASADELIVNHSGNTSKLSLSNLVNWLKDNLPTKRNQLTYIDGKAGMSSISIPSGTKEVIATVELTTGNFYAVHIVLAEIVGQTSYVYYGFGNYTTSVDNAGGKIGIKQNSNNSFTIYLNSIYLNGTDNISNAYLKVYGA